MRGIRGAICAEANTKQAIHRATQNLLEELVRRNGLRLDDVLAALFTMTPDLDADFPAYAARNLGWTSVPMLGAQESDVTGAPQRAIRVLVLAQGDSPTRHVYLGEAAAMRPDLAEPGDLEWRLPSAVSGEVGDREKPQGRLLVVGLGLIGGSVAVAARESCRFSAVRGFDRDRDTASLAERLGLVDATGSDLGEELGRADLVVLAVPVQEIVKLVSQVGRRVAPGAVVTDVGSTKRHIVSAMGKLPEGVRAVGGHPMAGSTYSGPRAARGDLVHNREWAVVSTSRSDDVALERVEALVEAVGARPVGIDADVHDAVVAITSHLPVLLAVGLVERAAELNDGLAAHEFLSGPGFAGASRLAAGDAKMTAQMLADNADKVASAIDGFIDTLGELREAMVVSPESLQQRLSRAGERGRAL